MAFTFLTVILCEGTPIDCNAHSPQQWLFNLLEVDCYSALEVVILFYYGWSLSRNFHPRKTSKTRKPKVGSKV